MRAAGELNDGEIYNLSLFCSTWIFYILAVTFLDLVLSLVSLSLPRYPMRKVGCCPFHGECVRLTDVSSNHNTVGGALRLRHTEHKNG